MQGGTLDNAWNSEGDPRPPTTHPQPETKAQLQAQAQQPAVAEILFNTSFFFFRVRRLLGLRRLFLFLLLFNFGT